MKLKRFGFFRELPHGESEGPSLRALVREGPSENEEAVIQYLESGVAFVACAGPVEDVLDPEAGLIGPPHVLTDGVWAWPTDLIHYVRKYHVPVPDAFRHHMEAKNWKVPASGGIDLTQFEM